LGGFWLIVRLCRLSMGYLSKCGFRLILPAENENT
jgi:hypothetical protein